MKQCPICKTSSALKDVRRHYLSPPKPKPVADPLELRLKQMEEELVRARRDLVTSERSLKAVQAALQETLNNESEKSHSKAMQRQEQQKTAEQDAVFKFLRPIYSLNCGHCIIYLPELDICVASCAQAAISDTPIQVLKPRLQGSVQVEPVSHLHGTFLIQDWWSVNHSIIYLPLHERPITHMVPSPHRNDIFLTCSLDGSIKVIQLSNVENRIEADVVVDIKIDHGATPIWCCIWDEFDQNVIHLAWKSSILAFDLRRSDVPLFRVDIAPMPQRPIQRTDKIFSIISVPAPASFTRRLIVGCTWGIMDLSILNNADFVRLQSMDSILLEAQGLQRLQDNTDIQWNLLCHHSSSHEVLLVGYVKGTCQTYLQKDIRENPTNDLLAINAPLAVPLPPIALGSPISVSGCLFSWMGDNYMMAQDRVSTFPTMTVRPPSPTPTSSSSAPTPHLKPPLVLSDESLRGFSSAPTCWTVMSNGENVAVAVASPSSLRFLVPKTRPKPTQPAR